MRAAAEAGPAQLLLYTSKRPETSQNLPRDFTRGKSRPAATPLELHQVGDGARPVLRLEYSP